MPAPSDDEHGQVVESVDVSAGIEKVWAAVSDPLAYPRWSPEASGARRLRGTGAFAVGDRFVGRNKATLTWWTVCTVVEVQPQRLFAFDVDLGPLPISRWSYQVEELAADATRVTETWHDRRTGLLGAPVRRSGRLLGRGRDAAAHNRETMQDTLRRVKVELEGPPGLNGSGRLQPCRGAAAPGRP